MNDSTETQADATAEAKVFTQEEVNAIAAKESRKAKDNATAGLLGELGIENPEDLKAIVAGYRKQIDAEKSAAEKLAEVEAERATYAEKATKYEALTASLLESALAQIPEDRRSLVPDFQDPAKTLAYVEQNRALLTAPVLATNVGSAGSPASSAASTVTFDDFKAMGLTEQQKFYTEHPAQAKAYGERLRNR